MTPESTGEGRRRKQRAPHRRVRVLVVDDEALYRDALQRLLELEGDIEVVGVASDASGGVEQSLASRPDVVLIDVFLRGVDGIEAARRIVALGRRLAVVMLSARHDSRLVGGALEAGATGFLTKRSSGRELRTAVRAAAAGRPSFSPEVLSDVIEARDHARLEHPAVSLTPRELEVLRLIAIGRSTPEIATALGVSRKTVAYHRHALLRKLGLNDTSALTRYAVRKGLVEA